MKRALACYALMEQVPLFFPLSMRIFCGMETINTTLGARAHEILLSFAEKWKRPVGEILTLLILETEWAGWGEIEDLLEQIAILKRRERRKRDRLRRKAGARLESPKNIEDYFEEVVESNFEIEDED